jgi:cardiolipin synthase
MFAATPMMTVPNLITLLRVLLIPLLVYFLAKRGYGSALLVFVAAALSDLLDGFIARRFKQISSLGAALDPVADKLMMLAAVILLASQGLLPVWLAVAIVVRDIVIVSGAAAYRWLISQVEIAPTLLSKLNTFLEFCIVSAVLASAAGLVDLQAWLPPFFVMVFLTVTVSGLHYVWVWGRKAARNARRAG